MLEKYILKCIHLKSENLFQWNPSETHLLKKLLQVVLHSSQGTNFKTPSQTHTHCLEKISN